MFIKKFAIETRLLILTGCILFCSLIFVKPSEMGDKIKHDQKSSSGHSIFQGTLVDLSWPEIKKAAESNAFVILPVAVIEQHGPHLNLGTDTYLAYHNSIALKKRLDSLHINSVVAPPVYWGIMQLHESGAFPGSFTVSPATMKMLLGDILEDLHRWGFRNVFCFNHHGDWVHRTSLKEAITEAKEKLGLNFYNDVEDEYHANGPNWDKYTTGKLYQPDYHSGAGETSAMLSYYPEFVNVNIVKTLSPENTWQPLGYVGDPANYNNINMGAFIDAEIDYQANYIAKWLKEQKQ